MPGLLWLCSNMQHTRLWGTLHPFLEHSVVMGRCVANEGFIRALLHLDPYDGYRFYLPTRDAGAHLSDALRDTPAVQRGALEVATRLELPAALVRESFHCFHLSDPMTEQPWLSALRNRLAPKLFPVTGVTHSLSYTRYGASLLAHMWPGCTRRDAIVSTSHAGCAVVERMFENLRQGYGLASATHPQPQVLRVPLGVDPASLPAPDEEARARERERLGVRDELVLLVVGRIAHYAKMDLLPLFRMLQRAESHGLPPGGYLLVIAGHAEADDGMPGILERMGGLHGVRVRVVRSPDDAERNSLYAAADIFLSPSDNVQETFGLTLLEAAAAGLPVVASDWDGYRDLVDDGVTGVLVPTLGPAESSGVDVAAPLLYDNQYHLLLAQQTAVDVEAFGVSIARLARSAALRAEMGRAGRERVLSRFSWDAVVARWVDLWDALWAEPVDEQCRGHVHPMGMAYADVFGTYPSARLDDNLRVRATSTGMAVYGGREQATPYPGVAFLVPDDVLKRLLFRARKGASLHELSGHLLPKADRVNGTDTATLPDTPCATGLVAAGKPDAHSTCLPEAAVVDDVMSGGSLWSLPGNDCLTPEGLRFLVLWALKHDLLEVC